MANAITYIKNVGKSVSYASFKTLKKMNPVFNDFAETNGQLATDMYKSIRNLKLKTKKVSNKIIESEYTKFVKNTLSNAKNDLKTGNFYNRERIERYEEESMGSFGDDLGFDFGDDDLSFGDMSSFGDGLDEGPSTNEMMDIVGEKTTNAISSTMAKSAEYIVAATTETNKATFFQMNKIYGGLHAGLSTINQNISKMLEFSSESVTTHFNNSSTFYREITKLDQERNDYLKQILENIKQLNEPAKKNDPRYKTNTYSDMVSYEGVLNITDYAKNIKKNIKNLSGGIFDILSLAMESGMLNEISASPISALMGLALEGMFTSAFGKPMKNLNKSLSSLTGNLFMGIKNKSRKEGGIWDTISEIFGIDSSLKTTIDVSRYEKGKIPFDGVTKKAIIEVIPTYLSKILSALNGQEENRFDYESGKFVTIDKLREEFENLTKNASNRAAYELDDIVRSKKSSLNFRDEKERKQFEDDWEAIKLYMYKNQRTFNTRDKRLKGSSFGLKGGMASDLNVKILQELLDGNPEALRYADQMFRERDYQNRRMAEYESSGHLGALFNGSTRDKQDTPSGTRSIVSSANNAVISELVAIRKELSYIRHYGTGGTRVSGGEGGPGPRPSFDDFDIPRIRSGNDRSYDESVEEAILSSTDNVKNIDIDKEKERILNKGKKQTQAKVKNLSFSDRMHAASGLSGKMAVLVNSATELAKKPAKFVVAMMDKADQRLYDLIYGPKNDNNGEKSFIGRLFNGLEGMFNKFSDFVTENIFEPLKDKFSREKLVDGFKDVFEKIFKKSFDDVTNDIKVRLFGTKETDENGNRTNTGIFGNFIDKVKGEFTSAGQWVKNTFKEIGDWMGFTSKKNQKGEDKFKRNAQRDEKANYFQSLADRVTSNITEAASGIKRVNKTGLAVISEGEMVIPPDLNPFNVAKRQRNERKVKRDLKNGIDSIFEFAKGTKDGTTEGGFSQKDQEDAKSRIFDRMKQKAENDPEAAARYARLYRNKKERFTREDFERLPFWMRVSDEAVDAARSLFTHMRENMGVNEEASEDFKNKAIDFMGKIKEHGHSMVAGAGIGAGVSLLTGLVGGPLVGAAVGAGIGLIKNSETVQNWLFGEIGEDGKRKGSKLISKDLSNNIQKYLPDMAKGATVGGILTALPIVPGGPVAGIVLGSAIGFAKNNENVQNALFGEDKLLGTKEQFQKKVQSVLPKMGVGALAGLVAGPFGLTTNILLGSALGFASDTNLFKDVMFGEMDENGKRKGGVIGTITDPFKNFIKKDVIQPLKDAMQPFTKQLQIMGKSLTDFIKNTFKENIALPVEKFLKDMIIDPLAKFLKPIFNFVTKPIKFLLSSPFKMIGGMGNLLRQHQIKAGSADYMTADQRLAFRRSRGWKMKLGDPRQDRFVDFDTALVNASDQDKQKMQEILSGIKASRSSISKVRESSNKTISTALSNKNIHWAIADKVRKLIEKENYTQAIKVISKSNLEADVKRDLINVVTSESAKLKITRDMKNNAKETTSKLLNRINELGFGTAFNERNIKEITKGKHIDRYLSMLDNEIKKPEGQQEGEEDSSTKATLHLNDEEEKRHKAITGYLDDFLTILMHQSKIDDEIYQEILARQTARNKATAGLDTTQGAEYAPSDASIGDKINDPYNDNIIKRAKNYYNDRGLIRSTLGLGLKGLGFGLKSTAKATKFAITSPYTVPKFAINTAKNIYNSDFVNGLVYDAGEWLYQYKDTKAGKLATKISGKLKKVPTTLWGDKNTDWRDPRKEVAVVSEDELVIPNVDDVNTYATGGVSGDKNNKTPSGITRAILNIEKGIAKLTGISLATAQKDGIDVSEVNVEKPNAIDNYFSKIKNKFKRTSNTVTQFVDGLPMKYRRDKNGDLIPDSSSAENKDTMKKIDEKQQTQRGILAGISDMRDKVSNIFSSLFGKKDDDEKSWLGKLFEKIPTAAKIAGAAAVSFGVLGWAKEKIFPGLKQLWDDKLEPYFNDAWNGKKEGFGKFIYFFNPANPEGLLPKFSNFISEALPKVATYISDGMNWVMRDVLPVAVSAIVTNLPIIAKGVITGITDGIGKLWRREKGDGTMKDSGSSDIKFTMNTSSTDNLNKGIPNWTDTSIDYKYMNSSSSITPSSQSETFTGSSKSYSATDKANSYITGSNDKSETFTGSSKSYGSSGSLPKAFDHIHENYRDKAASEYEKVKNNMTGYGVTVKELLNSDEVFAHAGDGTPIRGYEFLQYNDLSRSIGMSVKLSKAELNANTKADGGKETTAMDRIREAALKSFSRGVVGVKTGVSGASKVIKGFTSPVAGLSKFTTKLIAPIGTKNAVGNAVKGAVKGAGNVASKAPGFINDLGQKVGGIFRKTTDVASELADDVDIVKLVNETATDNVTKVTKKPGLLSKLASKAKGKFDEFIVKLSEAFKGFLKNSKVYNKLVESLTSMKGTKVAKEVIEKGISKFADFISKQIPELLTKYGGKMGAKAAAKLSLYTLSAATLMIADAVLSFSSGYRNANTMLGITVDPSVPIKTLCGIFEALNSVFCLGLVPIQEIMTLGIEGAKLIGFDIFGDLNDLRDAAKKEVEEYNREHGTNHSIESFNKKDRWTTKAGNAIKSGISTAGQKTTEFFDWVNSANPFNKKTAKAKTTVTEATAMVSGSGGSINYLDAWSGKAKQTSLLDNIDNTYATKKSVSILDAVQPTKNIVQTQSNVLASPTLLLSNSIDNANTEFNKFSDSLKDSEKISKKDEELIKKSKDGSISPFSKEYWTPNTKFKGLAGVFNNFSTYMKKIFNLPVAVLSQLGTTTNATVEQDIVPTTDVSVVDTASTTTTTGGNIISKVKNKITGFFGGLFGKGSGLYVGRASNLERLAEKSQSNEVKDKFRISGNEFISQIDSRYKDKKFNIAGDTEKQTLGDTGCAPAAAAMAINSTIGTDKVSMDDASKRALRYKVKNDGVNASYFNDEFARHGINAQYITSQDSKVRNQEIVRQLINNKKVVLMGQDQNNISKSTSPFGPNPHYVVANGMSPDGKYIYINDPESRVPNVRYKTENILRGSQMGVSAAVARGSRALSSKIRKFVGRAKMTKDQVAEHCWIYFRSRGFSEESTAGILGNLKQESDMDPTLLQNGRGPAAGICQMETYGDYSSRWGDMARLAESRGRDWTDLESQLDFMIQDMPQQFSWFTGKTKTYNNGTQTWWPEKMTLEQFKQLKDIDKATEVFERVFERPSIPMREQRKQYAREYYSKFTGKPITAIGSSSSSSSSSSTGTILDKIYGPLADLAAAYGLGVSSSDSSLGTVKTADGNVSSNSTYAAQQKALVEKMYSVEGKLKYAQDNAKYPGSRNPDDGLPNNGSGDCSSTVQWAYKHILGIDPGDWTGAQEVDTDTYKVADNVNDESKLQLGDLILYRKGGKSSHVEMYAGNGKMIGHGSGYGPKVKDLQQNYGSQSVYMVKRYKGFRGSGSGLADYIGRGSEIAENAAYDNALRHIKPNQFKSLLPMGYNEEEIKDRKISVMSYGKNKLSDVTIRNANGRASLIETVSEIPTATRKDTPVNTDNNMIELVKSIVKLLAQEVANTDKLNTIVKLLGEYMSAVNTSDDSKQSKEVALVARQNLINAMQSGGGSSQYSNPQLMKLIEATERIARE